MPSAAAFLFEYSTKQIIISGFFSYFYMRAKFVLIALMFLSLMASAQQLPTATVYGKVTDEQGHPIEMANVVVLDLLVCYTTN